MNINALILAAEYLDRKEREADHGYATTLPSPVIACRPERRRTSRLRQSLQGCRSSHNELEKNRRAHMKQCLEQLKRLIPLSPDLTKHTTLGLLTNATAMIRSLRDTEHQQKQARDQLVREQQYLNWHIEQMTKGSYRSSGQYRVRPSVSESSNASTESTSSELDDIDVIGSGLGDDADEQFGLDTTSDICGIASEILVISCASL